MMMPVSSSLSASGDDQYSYAYNETKSENECSPSNNNFVNSLDHQMAYAHSDNELKITKDSSNLGTAYLTSKDGDKEMSVEEPVQVEYKQAVNNTVDLSSVQPWKRVMRRTQSELVELSVSELQQLLGVLHSASQDASLCLVSLLQSRHSLEEQLELRNVAIEQLLRLAEKHVVVSCPASPGMTGRG